MPIFTKNINFWKPWNFLKMKILTSALQNFGIGILNSYLTFGYLTLFCSIKKISTLHPIAESDSNVDPSDSVKWNLLIAESDSNVDNLSRWKIIIIIIIIPPAWRIKVVPQAQCPMPSMLLNLSWRIKWYVVYDIKMKVKALVTLSL